MIIRESVVLSGRLVAPSCRLVANAVGLVAYLTQNLHYAQWLCYCCVSCPGYVHATLVYVVLFPNRVVWSENIFGLEMASETTIAGFLISWHALRFP